MSGTTMALLRRLRGSRLAGFALAYAVTAALQKGIGFLLFLWVAHTLDVSDYAVFGLLYALQSGLTSFASAGIVESAIALLRDHPDVSQRRRLFAAANSAFAVLALVSVLFAAAIGAGFMHGAAGRFVNLASVSIAGLAAAYVAIQASLVRLEEHHPASLALGFFVPTAALVGGGLGLFAYGTVTGFYLGSALGSVLSLLPFVLLRIGHHAFLAERAAVVRVLVILAPFMLIAVLAWLSGYGNTWLVDLFFDSQQVASFAFVYSVTAVMQLVATALNQVWSPRFYRMVHDMTAEEVERRMRLFTTLQGVALGAVGGAMLLAYTPALDLAGGNLVRYRDLRLELFVLFVAYAVSIPWWHSQNYFYAHGRGRELMGVSVVSALVGLAAWVACALAFGALGAYLGFLAQMIARAAFALAWARREWRIRIAWEGTLLAMSGMAAGLFVAAWLFGGTPPDA